MTSQIQRKQSSRTNIHLMERHCFVKIAVGEIAIGILLDDSDVNYTICTSEGHLKDILGYRVRLITGLSRHLKGVSLNDDNTMQYLSVRRVIPLDVAPVGNPRISLVINPLVSLKADLLAVNNYLNGIEG